ncbi:MAG: DEAD/DEAH box helicase family protein [Spirochaetota bacterium]
MEDKETILSAIAQAKSRLEETYKERSRLLKNLGELQQKLSLFSPIGTPTQSIVTANSTPQEKISLFRSLFRGRNDVYSRLWVNKKNGNKGYSPVCNNEWISGTCRKPTLKCGECQNKRYAPVTDDVVKQHLEGNITMGVYPLLKDDTCYFLVIDFDKKTWQDDVKSFMEICSQKNILASLERSRSGKGGHIWIFFFGAVPAESARHLGTFLITETMEQWHQLDMKSYDRLFPNQDIMPKGGFGNLIALPLQKIPRENGNSVFIDNDFNPYPDQWLYLSSIRRMSPEEVQAFVHEAIKTEGLLRIRSSQTDEDPRPWERTPTGVKLSCKLPEKITVVLANRIYIPKEGLPSQLLIHIKRLAAFQNPEFYRKQSMRFSTALTPRIICCAENIDQYLAIPRGCLDDLKFLLSEHGVLLEIQEKRFDGSRCRFNFKGELSKDQERAYKELRKHETGILVTPPGIGKTVIGIRLIAARKTNTLILVHRKPLLEQWRVQISLFLGIPLKEIGQIGGGKDNATNVIDVAMIQSLYKRGEVDTRIKNYGYIIADECHHVSAVSFEHVMMESNARYITGLTATPYRRDGHQPIIAMQCGPICYRVKPFPTDELSFKKVVITRNTNFLCPWSAEDTINSIWPYLIKDEDRNQMICADVLNNLKEKRTPLILTERKEHLEILKEKLQPFVKHLVILHGGMKSNIHREMVAQLIDVPANEEWLILATGPYIGEGFDNPRLDTLFLTMPFSFRGRMIQYAGRLHRQYKGKNEIRVYDYIDTKMAILQRMYQRRLKAYRSLGYVEISDQFH